MSFLRFAALLVLVSGSTALLAQQQPTAEEAAFIYELNRARQNPQRYDTENSLAGLLNGVAAQPPLALNLNLVQSARFHSTEMATFGYFAHTSAVTGDQPNKMARDAGYPLYSAWGNNNNFIESLAASGSGGAGATYNATDALRNLIIDAGVVPPGHRIHLLAMNAHNQSMREVGTGYAEGAHWSAGAPASAAYWSIHTGRRDTDPIWLTGVVYDDANANGRYDEGEGLSGVTVAASGATTTSVQSQTGGMWMMQANAGSTTLTCSGGSFVGTATRTFTVGTANMAIDFASGRSAGELDFEFQQVGGGPVLTVNSSMTVFNSPAPATPSTEQSYTVSGVRLVGNVTITAPSEFQVSTTSGSGFGGSVTLTPSGGTLATTTVYVRFNPSGASGANGDITNVAAGALDSDINVIGTVSTNPAVFVSPGSLTLTAAQLGATSPEMSYTLEGYNLSVDITVTAPTDFEVSQTSGSGFGGSTTVTQSGGIVSPTTIYVRYVPTTVGGSGNVTNVSGATSANVSLTGNVTNAPVISRNPSALTMVSSSIGVPSGEQSFIVSGQYLGGDITLTAPAGFDMTTTSGSGYATSIVLTESGGVVGNTTVYVRYLGGAGGSSGNLSCASPQASTVNVALTGQIAPPPALVLSTSSLSFTSPLLGQPSSERTYTVTGSNMLGDVTITVSGDFEVSLASGSGFGPSVTITVTGSALVATTVYVRYVPTNLNPVSGSLSHTSPGANSPTVALAGSIGSGSSGGGDDSGGGGCAAGYGSPWTVALIAILGVVAVYSRRRRLATQC